jgi:hypothetical protein
MISSAAFACSLLGSVALMPSSTQASVFDFSNGDCLGDANCIAAGAGNDLTESPFSFTSGGQTTSVTGFSSKHGAISRVYYQRSIGAGRNGLGVAYDGYESNPNVGGNEPVNINFSDELTFSFTSPVQITEAHVLDRNETAFTGDLAINGVTYSVIGGVLQGLPSSSSSSFAFTNIAAPSGIADDSAYFVSKIA